MHQRLGGRSSPVERAAKRRANGYGTKITIRTSTTALLHVYLSEKKTTRVDKEIPSRLKQGSIGSTYELHGKSEASKRNRFSSVGRRRHQWTESHKKTETKRPKRDDSAGAPSFRNTNNYYGRSHTTYWNMHGLLTFNTAPLVLNSV